MKVNVIAPVELELTYNDAEIMHISFYVTGDNPLNNFWITENTWSIFTYIQYLVDNVTALTEKFFWVPFSFFFSPFDRSLLERIGSSEEIGKPIYEILFLFCKLKLELTCATLI